MIVVCSKLVAVLTSILHSHLKSWCCYLVEPSHLYSFSESRLGSGSSHHHLHAGKDHRLYQTLHEHRHQHPVPQTQRHQKWLFLLPEPHDSWHLGVHPPGLPGSELRPVCHCQVGYLSFHPAVIQATLWLDSHLLHCHWRITAVFSPCGLSLGSDQGSYVCMGSQQNISRGRKHVIYRLASYDFAK